MFWTFNFTIWHDTPGSSSPCKRAPVWEEVKIPKSKTKESMIQFKGPHTRPIDCPVKKLTPTHIVKKVMPILNFSQVPNCQLSQILTNTTSPWLIWLPSLRFPWSRHFPGTNVCQYYVTITYNTLFRTCLNKIHTRLLLVCPWLGLGDRSHWGHLAQNHTRVSVAVVSRTPSSAPSWFD